MRLFYFNVLEVRTMSEQEKALFKQQLREEIEAEQKTGVERS